MLLTILEGKGGSRPNLGRWSYLFTYANNSQTFCFRIHSPQFYLFELSPLMFTILIINHPKHLKPKTKQTRVPLTFRGMMPLQNAGSEKFPNLHSERMSVEMSTIILKTYIITKIAPI